MELWSKGLLILLWCGVALSNECPATCPCRTQHCEFSFSNLVVCPERFTTLPGVSATKSDDCVCVPGYKGNMALGCEICTGTEYCPLNSVEPVPCPHGFECNATTAMPLPGVWNENHTSFQLCPAGFTCSRDGHSPPVICEPGRYCPEGMDDSIACPAGFFCLQGSGSPQICPVGSYCNASCSTPARCPEGSYCVAGSITPVVCPLASFCPAGSGEYLVCPAGRYCSVGVSVGTICPVGFYCVGNSSNPMPCSNGMLCLEGSSSNSVPCPGGMTCVGSVIVPCVAGKYCPEGSSAGITCPDGSYCSAGLSAPIVCDRGIICLPGSVDDRTPCPPGMQCINGKAYQCPASLYCPMGSYAGVPCPAAEYCPAGSARPVSCPAAKYCPVGVSKPIDCTAGSYCTANTAHPIVCPEHFYCPAGSSSPIPCPHGHVCPQGSSGTDQMCPAGMVCEGGSVVGPCPATYYCQNGDQVACLDGEICLQGSSAPTVCKAGTYCPAGSLEPQPCPADFYCAERVGMFAPCPDMAICPATTVQPCFGVPPQAVNLTRLCEWNCSSGFTVNADGTECIAKNETSFATLLDFGTGDAVVDHLFLKNLTGQVEVQGGCGTTAKCKAIVLSILRKDGTTVYCDKGYCPGYDSDGNEVPNVTTQRILYSTTDPMEDVSTTEDWLNEMTTTPAVNATGRRLLQVSADTAPPSVNPRVAVGLISVTPVSVNISFHIVVGAVELSVSISFNIPVNNTAFGDTKELLMRIIELILAPPPPPQPTSAPVVFPITAEQGTMITWAFVAGMGALIVAVMLCFYVVCKKDIYWCCGVMCVKCCGVKEDVKDIHRRKRDLENGDSYSDRASTRSLVDSISDGSVTNRMSDGSITNRSDAQMAWPRIDPAKHIKMV